jgi:hypothetical protein
MLVVFGGDGNRLVFGAGGGAAGPGMGGAPGAAVAPQPPQLLQFGQTHCTVQVRTGVSFVTGQTINLWISRTRQRQSQPSWQPLLHGSQALQPLAHPPLPAPQLSQHSFRSPMRVTPGMQISLQAQQYLCSVVFFVVQVIWQTGTSLQPQCGQQSQQAWQPALQPAWQPPAPQHPVSPAWACPSKAMPHSRVSPMVGNTYFVMVIISCSKHWMVRPAG